MQDANHNNLSFNDVVAGIKLSDVYENMDNWEERGLTPSENDVIQQLRYSTNDFIDNLKDINNAETSLDSKHTQVAQLVDELPWDAFDTEKKMFLADTLAPAIDAMGLDAWSIF